jgi:hypothetical protein
MYVGAGTALAAAPLAIAGTSGSGAGWLSSRLDDWTSEDEVADGWPSFGPAHVTSMSPAAIRMARASTDCIVGPRRWQGQVEGAGRWSACSVTERMNQVLREIGQPERDLFVGGAARRC